MRFVAVLPTFARSMRGRTRSTSHPRVAASKPVAMASSDALHRLRRSIRCHARPSDANAGLPRTPSRARRCAAHARGNAAARHARVARFARHRASTISGSSNAIACALYRRRMLAELALRSEAMRIEANPAVAAPLPSRSDRNRSSRRMQNIGMGRRENQRAVGVGAGFTGQGVRHRRRRHRYQWDHPHPATALPRLERQRRSITTTTGTTRSTTRVGNPCGNNSPAPCDDQRHGTHTAGTFAGDDGASRGIRSVSRRARNGSAAATWIKATAPRALHRMHAVDARADRSRRQQSRIRIWRPI